MKKKLLIVLGVLAVAVFFVFAANPLILHQQTVPSVVRVPAPSSVSVTLDSGSTISTVSGVMARNAFDALSEAAKKQHLELKTKQYDFGVFVEQIGTLVNTKEKSWIYFVNGTPGTVAADKQNLKTGDTVEWKYIPPIME